MEFENLGRLESKKKATKKEKTKKNSGLSEVGKARGQEKSHKKEKTKKNSGLLEIGENLERKRMDLERDIFEELEKLNELEEQARDFLQSAPEGSLKIVEKENKEQYYWRINPKDGTGKYIKKKEQVFIRKLAQKDYAKKFLKKIQEQRYYLEQLIEKYHPEEIQKIYKQMSKSKQKLIIPYILSEEEYILQWEADMKRKKEELIDKTNIKIYNENMLEIYTEKGEIVRSKSEKIIADKLYMMGIPYVYEVPLYLTGYGYIVPDFTVLNKRTRQKYYLEHFGLMDNEDYCEKVIKKIESFEKNEIFPGDQLLLTYETKKHPLNTKIVEKIIIRYLL